ncbi:hypothetical protein BDV38DRAFT_287529 [Aspergillus pseudotamarii]|uniref:Uncharacterized protein n=1 Tax=Aspergillus pseudotamarii TaxID=132259 RepID=A0A5N6SG01_ASPPS|nr:uncharacterized protein BDV38DRAFT_287529 [Aspergillus pseudotamarii]KAE8132611.1 hypothetical protein BDV38DRAFT_287529 [Aspergillus pseudotamarii]
MGKRANEASKKRPIPSPGGELRGSNKAKYERNEENDSEIFTMDGFSTDPTLRARHVAAKQASFDEPFELSEGDFTLTHAIRARVDASPPTAERETVAGAPLSNDTIADILKKVKPDCYKAQAWVKAHEVSKAAMERVKTKSENPDNLKKKSVRELHSRARQADAQFEAPRYQATAPAPNLQAPEDRTVEEELEDARVVYNRVSLAHDRLLKTIADIEDFRKTLS